VPYVVTIRESGVYDWHEVADSRDAILHRLLIVDGEFLMFEFRGEVEGAVRKLNKDRIKRYREAKESQLWLLGECE
jgi:hypothetical protein